MVELKGSQTEKNLLTAFAGESQARNKYTYFSDQAEKEGYIQIAAIFAETANQEREHAKREFKFLKGGEAQIAATFPAGVIGSTLENLKAAAAGEHYETNEMYPGFADVAEKEGFGAIATTFRSIAVAEKRHEDRYMALINNINTDAVFKREKSVRWICRNCGYVHEGPEAPKVCAACVHPQAYFELDALNY
ncbi:MAG: rubrerythrin family protein [Planctomycetes bacterium B3_Pla]|nr:MAG: rubrerythrin family protein [Planctomycetes bacterium B3_Pla]